MWTNRSIQVGFQTYLFCHVDRRHRQFALHSFVSIESVCQATSVNFEVVVKMYKLCKKESPQVSHYSTKDSIFKEFIKNPIKRAGWADCTGKCRCVPFTLKYRTALGILIPAPDARPNHMYITIVVYHFFFFLYIFRLQTARGKYIFF